MKHRFTFSLLSIFIFSTLIFSNSAFAVESPAPKPTPPASKAVPIANVNMQNARVISRNGNTFNVYFELANGKIPQNGVKYGVKLVSTTKTGQTLVDERIYAESLTLAEDSLTKKDLIYTAPTMLTGTYSLVLFSSNSSGLALGIVPVEEVKLTASTKGLEVVTDSCYLKVEGEKSGKHYGLLGVDIGKDETLRLTCNTINHTKDNLSLTPLFETRYHSAYGDTAPATGGDIAPISFKAGKSESFSVLLPKATMPRVYNVNIRLVGGSTITNSVSAQYVIRGMSAIIRNLSFDKDYYKRGDKAVLSMVWLATPPSASFPRGGKVGVTSTTLNLSGTITNVDGHQCASPIEQKLTIDNKNPKVEIPVSITSKCINPKVALMIKDAEGNTLDQKEFNIKTTSMPERKSVNPKTILWIVIAIAIVVSGSIYMKKKKKTGTDINS